MMTGHEAEVARLRAALEAISYWHRWEDEEPAPESCRTCRVIALAGINLKPPEQPDPALTALPEATDD